MYKTNVYKGGIKQLAYKTKGHTHGYYVTFDWQGTEDNVKKLENLFRANNQIIKFLTVQ